MKPREIYDELFFDSFDDIAQASAEAVVPMVLDRVPATSVIDVGCGRGYWLRAFRQAGVDRIFGVDGGRIDANRLVIPPDDFAAVDLAGVVDGKPLNVSPYERFDLATCMEVAEHLPENAADHFVRGLTELAPVLLFSAAIPRQGGTGHLNERWPSYWAAIFARYGYVPVDGLRRLIWRRPDVGAWYRQNLLMYDAGERLGQYEKLAGDVVDDIASLDIVHPDYYESQFVDRRSVRDLMGVIPQATIKSVEARVKRMMAQRGATPAHVEEGR